MNDDPKLLDEQRAINLLCQMYLPCFDEEEQLALTTAIAALEEKKQAKSKRTTLPSVKDAKFSVFQTVYLIKQPQAVAHVFKAKIDSILISEDGFHYNIWRDALPVGCPKSDYAHLAGPHTVDEIVLESDLFASSAKAHEAADFLNEHLRQMLA